MKTSEMILSPIKAREIALAEAGIQSADFTSQTIEREAGQCLYRLEYNTDYMDYCCYIDARKGTVLGFDYQPGVA